MAAGFTITERSAGGALRLTRDNESFVATPVDATPIRATHPRIMPSESWSHDGQLYSVRRAQRSLSASDVLDAGLGLGIRLSVYLGLQVLEALSFLERSGAALPKVSTHNLLLLEDGRVVVADLVDKGGDGVTQSAARLIVELFTGVNEPTDAELDQIKELPVRNSVRQYMQGRSESPTRFYHELLRLFYAELSGASDAEARIAALVRDNLSNAQPTRALDGRELNAALLLDAEATEESTAALPPLLSEIPTGETDREVQPLRKAKSQPVELPPGTQRAPSTRPRPPPTSKTVTFERSLTIGELLRIRLVWSLLFVAASAGFLIAASLLWILA